MPYFVVLIQQGRDYFVLIEKDTLRYFSPESFIGILDSWQLLDQKGYL